MSDVDKSGDNPGPSSASDTAESDTATSFGQSRRHMLQLGAVGTAALVTIRPALAQGMGSVMNCQIPVPDPRQGGKYVAADGRLVAPGTAGSFAPAGRPFTGQEVKRALGGRSLPGVSYDQSQAYINYIRRLQFGQSGYTCFVSLQMPRR